MLLIDRYHCGRIPEDMPRESDNLFLLIYTPGGNHFLGRYENRGTEGLGVWVNEEVERKVVVGDCWVELHESPPECLTRNSDRKK